MICCRVLYGQQASLTGRPLFCPGTCFIPARRELSYDLLSCIDLLHRCEVLARTEALSSPGFLTGVHELVVDDALPQLWCSSTTYVIEHTASSACGSFLWQALILASAPAQLEPLAALLDLAPHWALEEHASKLLLVIMQHAQPGLSQAFQRRVLFALQAGELGVVDPEGPCVPILKRMARTGLRELPDALASGFACELPDALASEPRKRVLSLSEALEL